MVELMRFKKGSKVEVLNQNDMPSGSWRCAEIIGGNGHYYTVMCDGNAVAERMHRRAIRPCPPSVDLMRDWVTGDVVEVFHDYSWKMAIVLMVSGWSHLLVRLVGFATEVMAHKYDVRARLCWHDGEWIVIGKASNVFEDTRFSVPLSVKKGDIVSMEATNGVTVSHRIPSRAPKRKLSHRHNQIEVYPQTEDNVSCSGNVRGENYVHPSYVKKITNGFSETASKRKKRDDVGFSRSISLELNDDDEDSISSSVGSCSVFAGGPFQDNDECQSSDAESFCELRYEEGNCVLPAKEELNEDIHRLELHAYRSTIEALHASGPLSWEQELLLTNLRDSLHISNDEHLREVKILISHSPYC